MIDGIIIAVLAALFLSAVGYIVKKKRKDGGCIGCPDSGCCGKNCRCSMETKE